MPEAAETLAAFGVFRAMYEHEPRRYYVLDTTTGAQFNANSRAHVIDKAKKKAAVAAEM